MWPQTIFKSGKSKAIRSIWEGRPDSELQIWRLDVKTGNAVRLPGVILPGRNMDGLSVHPGGRRIAFTAGRIYPGGGAYRAEVRVVENIAARLDQ